MLQDIAAALQVSKSHFDAIVRAVRVFG
jgi:hypothetical protein